MPQIAPRQAVDRIDVVSIGPVDNWNRWSTLPGPVIGTWPGDRARTVLDLVAVLPESSQARCFLPRYGIRVFSASTVLAEVAFCFRCHNALIVAPESTPHLPRWFTFDPASPPGEELLHLFRACTDEPAS